VSNAYTTFLGLPEPVLDGSVRDIDLVQARALFSKDEDMLSPVDQEGVVFKTFLDTELSCSRVNGYFRDRSARESDVECILFYAQRKIESILGECPPLSELDMTFGKGSTTSCSEQKVSARWKLSTPPSISQSGIGSLRELIPCMPGYFKLFKRVEVHPGKLDFVPKNWKTMRSICIEPTLNTMVQRGIGRILKQKCLRAGINLFDQGINRNRARVGSVTQNLSTIDLSSASDSIAYGLVMDLLPWEWFHLLDSFRTGVVTYRGESITLEKFSSMGNGYTFELESLIFYSISYGIAKHFSVPFDLTVYGDDLVCNNQLAARIIEWFPKFGFSVNKQKSFSTGPFRESCGGDYVNGVDIRPFFPKGRFTYARVVSFYNLLMRKPQLDRCGLLRQRLFKALPLRYHRFGPDGYGDGHLISDITPLKPHRRRDGYSGGLFETITALPRRDVSPCYGDLLLPAYSSYAGTSREAPTDHYVVRSTGKKKKPPESKVTRVYVLGI